MSTNLRTVTFYNAVVSGSSNGTWASVDWKFGGVQQRTVIGTKDTANTVDIHVRITDPSTGLSIISTATSWGAGITSFATVISGPYHDIRVRNLGGNGTAGTSVVGVI